MPRHCFTYGSLMCDDIMAAVCGARFAWQPARLAGHARHPVRNEAYPGMVAAADGTVNGVLYLDVDDAALARLDRFEGPQYERRTVTVALADGSAAAAETYVFRADHAHLLLPGPWDFVAFLTGGKEGFTARYVGYARIEAP